MGIESGRAPTTPVPRRAPGRRDPRRPGATRLHRPSGSESDRTVHPLGIVAKGPTWYLVSGTEAGRRTFRVDRVSSVDPTDDPVHRPEGFDLAESWREIADEVDRKRTPLETHAVCSPDGIGLLRMLLGSRLEVGGSTTDSRVEVVIRGHDEYTSAAELAGLVEWLEVTGPPGVQGHLASIGNALVGRYGRDNPGTRTPSHG